MAKTMYNGQMVEVEDATPTWHSLVPMMVSILGSKGNEAGKAIVKEQMLSMARAADKLLLLSVQAQVCSKEYDDPNDAAEDFRVLGNILKSIREIDPNLRARVLEQIKESYS